LSLTKALDIKERINKTSIHSQSDTQNEKEMKVYNFTLLAVLAIMTEGTKEGLRGMDQLDESTVALTPQRGDVTRHLIIGDTDGDLGGAHLGDKTAPPSDLTDGDLGGDFGDGCVLWAPRFIDSCFEYDYWKGKKAAKKTVWVTAETGKREQNFWPWAKKNWAGGEVCYKEALKRCRALDLKRFEILRTTNRNS